ncbi:hypothetical protein LV476_04100 [Guyparkeria hydrothermalis]|uniref:hypothetical protein n=1 Tax=Guyparkeria hydrothermalis TaxID=923 RepID=UPI0020209672|nr:hypothetical protein [Guyparkeria hydrothermalis]MCL7744135.1 hypothetical protein [Guyparkeria hydrothermalis]
MMRTLLGILVLGALGGFWLTQQTPGNEYTTKNRLLHFLTVDSKINLYLSDLDSSLTESDIKERFANLALDCGSEASDLGDRSCYAPIQAVNDIDAWFAVFFFQDQELSGVKIDLPPSGHAPMSSALHQRHGEPRGVKVSRDQETTNQWYLRNGAVVMNRDVADEALSMVYWASVESVVRKRMSER